MTCPVCGEKTTVKDALTDCEVVCRERKCTVCGHVFYTEEHEAKSYGFVNVRYQYHKEKQLNAKT